MKSLIFSQKRTMVHLVCFFLLSFSTDIFAYKWGSDLHDAAYNDHFAIVKIFVDSGSQIDLPNRSGRTPLYYAVLRGNLEIASYLLDKGADPNFQDDGGVAPIHVNFFASMAGNPISMLDLMLMYNGNVNLQDDLGKVPMNYAITRGDLPAIKKLIDSGAQAEHTTNAGDTFLMQAVWQRYPTLINHFLSLSIDINTTNEKGWSAISMAVVNKDLPTVSLLLSKGADSNVGTIYGLSNLAYATTASNARIMDTLARNKADLGHISKEGFAPLSLAISNCDMGRTNLLLALGAKIDIGRPDGHSNFYHAVLKCNPNLVKTLHRHNPDINEVIDKARSGKMTALDQAIMQDNQEMIDYLRSIGAKTTAELNL